NGFPTPNLEDWKYTNASSAVSEKWLVNGESRSIGSDLDIETLTGFRYDRNGFTALNQAFAAYRVIRIPKETSVDEPFVVEHSAPAGEAIFPHTIVIAEAGSRATLVETFASEA